LLFSGLSFFANTPLSFCKDNFYILSFSLYKNCQFDFKFFFGKLFDIYFCQKLKDGRKRHTAE